MAPPAPSQDGRTHRASDRPRLRRWLLVWLAAVVGVLLAIPLQAPTQEPTALPDTGGRVLSIAHGGAQGHAPGNTPEAFRIAVEQGVDRLEMDVQLTADGDVVVFHDGHLEDKTDGTGPVVARTVEQLQALDGGYRWTDVDGVTSARGQGHVIPTLREVVEEFEDIPLTSSSSPTADQGWSSRRCAS